MVVAAFSMVDKANRVRFFEKTFLVANISLEIVFRMSFLTLSSADVDFSGWEYRWKTYTNEKALPTTRCIELVGKKEFAATALDPKHETYVVHIVSLNSTLLASLGSTPLNVHPSQKLQISGLIAEKASTKVSAEYSDFADVFSSDVASKLFEHTGINNYAKKLVNIQQPSYGSIYNLWPVELETLKA